MTNSHNHLGSLRCPLIRYQLRMPRPLRVFVLLQLTFTTTGAALSLFVLSTFECVVGRFRSRKASFLYGFLCGRLFTSMWRTLFRWTLPGRTLIGHILLTWTLTRRTFSCCVLLGEMRPRRKLKASLCFRLALFGGPSARHTLLVPDGSRFRLLC